MTGHGTPECASQAYEWPVWQDQGLRHAAQPQTIVAAGAEPVSGHALQHNVQPVRQLSRCLPRLKVSQSIFYSALHTESQHMISVTGCS